MIPISINHFWWHGHSACHGRSILCATALCNVANGRLLLRKNSNGWMDGMTGITAGEIYEMSWKRIDP